MRWVVNVTPQLRFTPGERTCGTRWKEWWVNLRDNLDTQARGKVPVLGIDGRKITHALFELFPLCSVIYLCHPHQQFILFSYTNFLFFLWLYSPLWTLASFMILPHIFLSRAFFHHVSTFNNFTSFKTLSSHLNLGLPFFQELSGCEKFIFLQGEFSSILTRCPSYLNLAHTLISSWKFWIPRIQ
jgi:hypothetical protein